MSDDDREPAVRFRLLVDDTIAKLAKELEPDPNEFRADYLRMARTTRRFFEVTHWPEAIHQPVAWPTYFGIPMVYDPFMPDGFLALVGPERPYDPEDPLRPLREIRWIDLRPKEERS